MRYFGRLVESAHPLRGAITLIVLCLLVPAPRAVASAAGIATAHPLATQAGKDILAAGGNAFDAAVAITAVLAVVEPAASGLGGGGFWLLHRAEDGRETMIDGRERAPFAATADMYLDAKGDVVANASIDGPRAAGIPGTPAALDLLARRYGKLPLKTSLQPAIKLAREGFVIDEHYRRLAGFRLEALRASPAAARIFLLDNEVPPPGYRLRQPDLATTLIAIAKRGADGFYRGKTARALVAGVRDTNGLWTDRDLAEYRAVEREPVRGEYHGIRVTSAAPPSSGGIALLTMLNIVAEDDLARLPKGIDKHLVIEAMRRAYRDRAVYLGDPDFVSIPVRRLINPDYAAGLRNSIRLDRATPSASLPGLEAATVPQGADTTHFSVLDGDGNRVAATLSINYPFGSGFVAPGTGVLLNDEMDDFSAKPGTPNVYGLIGSRANAIEAGKRPLSSMTPTFLDGPRGVAILGTPGGSRIITMVLLGALDFAAGNGPQSWVSVKRYHHQFEPDVVSYEPDAFSPEEVEVLRGLGHSLKQRGRPYGNMQAVFWDRESGAVSAASDPRGGGLAIVIPSDD